MGLPKYTKYVVLAIIIFILLSHKEEAIQNFPPKRQTFMDNHRVDIGVKMNETDGKSFSLNYKWWPEDIKGTVNEEMCREANMPINMPLIPEENYTIFWFKPRIPPENNLSYPCPIKVKYKLNIIVECNKKCVHDLGYSFEHVQLIPYKTHTYCLGQEREYFDHEDLVVYLDFCLGEEGFDKWKSRTIYYPPISNLNKVYLDPNQFIGGQLPTYE